jgi:hypothetical protein
VSGGTDYPRRIYFQRRALDENDERKGAWTSEFGRRARLKPLLGGEVVQRQRLEGSQPVILYVRADRTTKAIDNAWRAVDAREWDADHETATRWGVTSIIWNEETDEVEIQAVQRRNGSDA